MEAMATCTKSGLPTFGRMPDWRCGAGGIEMHLNSDPQSTGSSIVLLDDLIMNIIILFYFILFYRSSSEFATISGNQIRMGDHSFCH